MLRGLSARGSVPVAFDDEQGDFISLTTRENTLATPNAGKKWGGDCEKIKLNELGR